MSLRLIMTALLSLCLLVPMAHADKAKHGYKTKHGDLTIAHATVRPNLPNRPTAAYMVIYNAGADDRLIGAVSPEFGKVELHKMEMSGDVMKMRMIEGIDIPKDGRIVLKAGGMHLMLFDAKNRYKDGGELLITLMFEKAGSVDVTFAVNKRAGSYGAHGKHGKKGHGDHGDHGKDDKKKHSH